MSVLDLVVGLAVVSAAAGGYRQGLLARVLSWVGLAAGVVLAVRALPRVVGSVGGVPPTVRLALAGGVLVVGAFVGQAVGQVVGRALRRLLPLGPVRQADRLAGAAAGAAGVVVALWLLLPSIAQVPGWPAREARRSALARAVDRLAPPPPDPLQAVRRLVGEEGFPRVFDTLAPAPEVGPPPEGVPVAAAVLAEATRSTVKVEGVACRRAQEGSGFVARPGLVVTNAHVVAGEEATTVRAPGGRRLAATVVAFDPGRDLAVLSVPGLDRSPLPVGEAEVGDAGAVLGHPGGQDDVRPTPAAVRSRIRAAGRDLYDERPTTRDVLVLAASLRPGDSGGALVGPDGAVLGVAFAIAPDRPDTAYALSTAELAAVLATAGPTPTPTGPCLAG